MRTMLNRRSSVGRRVSRQSEDAARNDGERRARLGARCGLRLRARPADRANSASRSIASRSRPDIPARTTEWVNSASLLARMNFAHALAQNKVPGIKVDAAQFWTIPPKAGSRSPDADACCRSLGSRSALAMQEDVRRGAGGRLENSSRSARQIEQVAKTLANRRLDDLRSSGFSRPVRGMQTRRIFLGKARLWRWLASALTPLWLSRALYAADAPGPRKKILVAIFQRGAVDGLNVVVPHGEQRYYDLRPTIAVPRPRWCRSAEFGHRSGRIFRTASVARSV